MRKAMELFFLCVLLFVITDEKVSGENTDVSAIQHTFAVGGHVTFAGEAPDEIPAGSWVTVKVEDTSLQDVSSILMGKYEAEIKDYVKDGNITYLIQDAIIPPDASLHEVSMNAIITVGDKREDIKKGDYLTMSVQTLPFDDIIQIYYKDVEVEKYD